MIHPLVLGNKSFPVNLIQGPLAGVSCAPFRQLTWRYSKPAFSCTEMISCKTLIHKPQFAQRRFIEIHPDEGPVCFQLAANNPSELAEATRRATDYGAALIDLNCGCPVKKIRSKGSGSQLLTDPQRLYQLIRTMKENTHLPVSIKIRVEGQGKEKFHLELVKAITDAGADFVTVHGRHWTEHYETACHYEDIQYFVESLRIPVIGNGDIACVASLKKMFATGCAGVMVSRAGVGQPWLIGYLMAEIANRSFSLPTPNEIGTIFIEHISALARLIDNEKFAVLQARKLGKYYARKLESKKDMCEALNTCDNVKSFEKLVQDYFV